MGENLFEKEEEDEKDEEDKIEWKRRNVRRACPSPAEGTHNWKEAVGWNKKHYHLFVNCRGYLYS